MSIDISIRAVDTGIACHALVDRENQRLFRENTPMGSQIFISP